jgi:hypothetical protein
LAWFKLDRIEDAELAVTELQAAWSYVRIDEFFETKKSIFDAFYDKQLTSFTEPRNQDRTIWFIRPKATSDAVNEIHVYDRSKTAPAIFWIKLFSSILRNCFGFLIPVFPRAIMIFLANRG